jgi:hypothetical protein
MTAFPLLVAAMGEGSRLVGKCLGVVEGEHLPCPRIRR